MRGIRRAAMAVVIGTSAALLAQLLMAGDLPRRLLDPLEAITLDWRMRSVPPRPAAESPVVLVLFDSATVAEWPYLSPFPRAALADLIDGVSAAGARVIGVDVFLDRRYPELSQLDGGDERLRESMRRAGNVVLAAATQEGDSGRVLLPPDPYFAEAASAIGAADLPTPYEVVRDAALTVRTDRGRVAGFSTALYAGYRGVPVPVLLDSAERSGRLPVPGVPERVARLPGSAVQTMPILFLGPSSRTDREGGAFPAFSASAILQLGPFVPQEWFRDRVVILGSGFHAEERFRTPFYDSPDAEGRIAGWTYGVEVHANALENLITGTLPRRLPTGAAFAIMAAMALAVTGVLFRKGSGWGVTTAVLLLGGYVALAFWLFGSRQIQLPLVGPTLALALAALGSTSYVSVVEGREKRAIRGAFAKYVSPEVVEQLVADPSRLKLGGERRTISILFSDLAGFTSLSERTSPERLVALLNRYLDEMTHIVLREGTLDKYIGDAVMAIFGAPTAQADHAQRACRTALRMQRRLRELGAEWAAEGWPALEMRIGVSTGSPVVGNIGGEKHFEYTALGDAVNLAARLEPACKSYGVDIMLSEETLAAAGDAIRVRELEMLAVYGKTQPVRVYELLSMAEDPLPVEPELLEQYDRGLEAFRRRDFALAAQYFEAALSVRPGDGPSELYLRRSRELVLNPPAEDWSFVARRETK